MYKIITKRALSQRVLVVAVADDHEWCAFCDAVPGDNHDVEAQAVVDRGDKLDEKLAKLLFPGLSNHRKWRE